MAIKKTTKKTVQTKKEKNTLLKKAAEKLEKAVSEDKIKRGKPDISSSKARVLPKRTEPVKTEIKKDNSIFAKKLEEASSKDSEIKTSSILTKRENIFDKKDANEKEDILVKKEEKKSSETLSELIANKQKDLAKKEESEKASGTYSKNIFSSSETKSSETSTSDTFKNKTEINATSSSYKPAVPVHKYGTNPYTYGKKKKSILFPISVIVAVIAFVFVVIGLYFLIIKPASNISASSSNTSINTNESVIMESSTVITSSSNETMLESQTTNAAIINETNAMAAETINTTITTEVESVPATPLMPALNAKEYTIQWKDSLSTIAAKQLGDERRWVTIYRINTDVIPSPDKYTFGTKVKLPSDKKRIEEMSKEELSALIADYDYTIDRYKKMNVLGEVKRLGVVRDNINTIMNKK